MCSKPFIPVFKIVSYFLFICSLFSPFSPFSCSPRKESNYDTNYITSFFCFLAFFRVFKGRLVFFTTLSLSSFFHHRTYTSLKIKLWRRTHSWPCVSGVSDGAFKTPQRLPSIRPSLSSLHHTRKSFRRMNRGDLGWQSQPFVLREAKGRNTKAAPLEDSGPKRRKLAQWQRVYILLGRLRLPFTLVVLLIIYLHFCSFQFS